MPKDTDLGDTCGYFTRHGTDHHAFVIFNRKVLAHRPDRRRFGPDVTINQITWQCGSLKEIVDAHAYFQDAAIPITASSRSAGSR